MSIHEIEKELISNSDEKYKTFHLALVPGVSNLIGVRLPRIRSIAKKYFGTREGDEFICHLPHKYYEEYMAHALMLGMMKGDRKRIAAYMDKFIPYIDNWAVCDSFVSSLKYFYKDRDEGLEYIKSQLNVGGEYSTRFALVSLLNYYLDSEYTDTAIALTLSVSSEAYYVRMAQAWLVSIALVKQYERTLWVIEENLLDPWVHNKSIQKAKESFRMSKERKEHLDSLRIRGVK